MRTFAASHNHSSLPSAYNAPALPSCSQSHGDAGGGQKVCCLKGVQGMGVDVFPPNAIGTVFLASLGIHCSSRQHYYTHSIILAAGSRCLHVQVAVVMRNLGDARALTRPLVIPCPCVKPSICFVSFAVILSLQKANSNSSLRAVTIRKLLTVRCGLNTTAGQPLPFVPTALHSA